MSFRGACSNRSSYCMFCGKLCFFFFKQKTAYDMRISDWSSDVCSSDLIGHFALVLALILAAVQATLPLYGAARRHAGLMEVGGAAATGQFGQIGRASGRERGCQYV